MFLSSGFHRHTSSPVLPSPSLCNPSFIYQRVKLLYSGGSPSVKTQTRKEREMEKMAGMVGRISRHFYAIVCLGVVLVSVAIAHYSCAAEPNEPRDRTNRRLRSLHGLPLEPSLSYLRSTHHPNHKPSQI